MAATHEASGTQGLVCGEGVLREGGVAQEGLHLAADVVGLELPRLYIGHVYAKPFHDRENLQNRQQQWGYIQRFVPLRKAGTSGGYITYNASTDGKKKTSAVLSIDNALSGSLTTENIMPFCLLCAIDCSRKGASYINFGITAPEI